MTIRIRSKASLNLLLLILLLGSWCACSQEFGVSSKPDETVDSQEENSNPSEVEWKRPRTEERVNERLSMVEFQIDKRGIDDDFVLEAMRHVPRHWFVPLFRRGAAYDDRPLGIGGGQTISQPYIVALMTEALELESGEKVLEVGTGSGYQAAVLSEITTAVYSVEIIERLAKEAVNLYQKKGYTVIESKQADGYHGWEEHAPYDAIIVTCAASHIPPTLVQQLKPGGKLCIPVGGPFSTQRLMLLTKMEDGTTRSKNLELVRFVPMTGAIEER